MTEHKPTTDLTPPTKQKAAAAPKKEKVAAATNGSTVLPNPGEGVPSVDGNAVAKKPRQPRKDYGFSTDAVISLVEGKDQGYRGQRLDWYNRIKQFAGKTTGEFMKAHDNLTTPKGNEDPPRGWVRFFVQDGSVTLSRPAGSPAVAADAPSASTPKKGEHKAENKAAA